MKVLKYLYLVLLSACSIFIPPHITLFKSPYDKELVIEAVDDFVEEWQKRFHQDISNNLNDLDIYFIGKTEKEWYTNGSIRGETDRYNYSYIKVAYNSENLTELQHTALWHELVHVTLGKLYDDADYNHSEEGGYWGLEHEQLISYLRDRWNKKQLVWNLLVGNNWYVVEFSNGK